MADPKYDQGVRREKDLLPYAVEMLPQDEFGDTQFDGELIFGHGDDGDVTVTSNTSLTEDMYYNNLTINSGKVLNTNGFRVFVKNTLTLNGDIGIKEDVASVTTGSLEGRVAVGASVTDGLGGAGEPDGYVSGYTFTGSGSINTSAGVTANDFYDLRDAVNSYKQRGGTFIRVKGGAGGGTGADGVSGTGAAGSWGPNTNTVGAAGGKGSAGTGGSGGTGGKGGAVVMVSARSITGSGGLYSEGAAGVSGSAGTDGTPAPSHLEPAYNHTVPGNHHAAVTNYHHTPTSHTATGTGTRNHANPPNPVEYHGGNPTPPGTGSSETWTVSNNPVTHHGVTNTPTHTTHPGTSNASHHNIPYPNHDPGNHNPTNHMMQPGNHHHSSGGGNPYHSSQTNYHTHANPPNPVGSSGGNPNPDGSANHATYHTAYGHGVTGVTTPAGNNPPQSAHAPAQSYPGGAGGTGYTGQRGGRGGGGVLIVVTRKAGTLSYSLNTGVNGRLIALDTANI